MNQPVAVHKFQDAQDFLQQLNHLAFTSVDRLEFRTQGMSGDILVPSKIQGFLQSVLTLRNLVIVAQFF